MKKILSTFLTVLGTLYGAYELYDFFKGEDFGVKLEFGTIELYYTDEVTEIQAYALGNFLDSADFSGGDPISLQLDKEDDTYQFNIVVKDGVANNKEYNALFRNVVNNIKTNIFPDDKLILNLTDNHFSVLQSIAYDEALANPFGEMVLFNGTEVYYKGASNEQVNALGSYLIDSEFADGSEKAVQLFEQRDTLIFKMIVDQSLIQDEYDVLFNDLRLEISEGAFNGKPVQLHAADEYFNTKKIFR